MQNVLDFFNKNEIVLALTTLTSLASVAVSLFLWLSVNRLKKQVNAQRMEHIKNQKSILAKINGIRKIIISRIDANDLELQPSDTSKIVSPLREELDLYISCYDRIIKKSEREAIESALEMIEGEATSFNMKIMCSYLDKIIVMVKRR